MQGAILDLNLPDSEHSHHAQMHLCNSMQDLQGSARFYHMVGEMLQDMK